jgi:pyruvate dehydrogenase kinase 2/3/4
MFLRNELPIRLAKRIVDFDKLPPELSQIPSILRVKNWYAESFEQLVNFKPLELTPVLKEKYKLLENNYSPVSSSGSLTSNRYFVPFESGDLRLLPQQTDRYNSDFIKLIESVKRRHDPVVTTLGTIYNTLIM